MQTAIDVILSNRNDQSKIGLDHFALSLFDFSFGGDDRLLAALDVDSRSSIPTLGLSDSFLERALLPLKLIGIFPALVLQSTIYAIELRFRAANLFDHAID